MPIAAAMIPIRILYIIMIGIAVTSPDRLFSLDRNRAVIGPQTRYRLVRLRDIIHLIVSNY